MYLASRVVDRLSMLDGLGRVALFVHFARHS